MEDHGGSRRIWKESQKRNAAYTRGAGPSRMSSERLEWMHEFPLPSEGSGFWIRDGDTDKLTAIMECHHLQLSTVRVVLIGQPRSWRIHSLGTMPVM